MPGRACNRCAVDLPAIVARRVYMSLALAVGGAVVFMAGISMAVIGTVLRLQHPQSGPGLIASGLGLAAIGLALGLACAGVVMASTQFRGPQYRAPHTAQSQAPAPPSLGSESPEPGSRDAAPAGPVADSAPADAADDWLSPFRGVGLRPVSSSVRDVAAAGDTAGAHDTTAARDVAAAHDPTAASDTAAARDNAAPAEQAASQPGPARPEEGGYQVQDGSHVQAGYPDGAGGPPPVQYSDAGWRLDGQDLAAQAQVPASPAPEIHHPVRTQHPAHTTSQFPAYQDADYHTGQYPAYDAGQRRS
jgi:hypothetical protein